MKSITTDRTIDNNKQPDYDTAFDEIKIAENSVKIKKYVLYQDFI